MKPDSSAKRDFCPGKICSPCKTYCRRTIRNSFGFAKVSSSESNSSFFPLSWSTTVIRTLQAQRELFEGIVRDASYVPGIATLYYEKKAFAILKRQLYISRDERFRDLLFIGKSPRRGMKANTYTHGHVNPSTFTVIVNR